MSKRKIMWQKRIDFLPILMCKLAINPIIIPDPRPLVSEMETCTINPKKYV